MNNKLKAAILNSETNNFGDLTIELYRFDTRQTETYVAHEGNHADLRREISRIMEGE